MKALSLWGFLTNVVAQNGNWIKYMLPGPGKCLDGSPGGYYLRLPLVPQAKPARTFLIYHEGGGWCANDENCYERAQGELGSSKTWPDLPPNRLPDTAGYEGASLFSSRYFANATIAYAKYCDGGSWASFNTTPTYVNNTRIWYMGRPMLCVSNHPPQINLKSRASNLHLDPNPTETRCLRI